MLILLSANKKRIVSFYPSATPLFSTKITSLEAWAFKYGDLQNSTYSTYLKESGYLVSGGLFSSTVCSYISADSFSFGATFASTKVSSLDASFIMYAKNPVKGVNITNASLGFLIANPNAERGVAISFEKFASLSPSNNMSNGFTWTLDRISNTLYAPSGSGISQTLVFQPE